MPAQRYTVDSAAPINIFPAGLQQSVTVLNTGEATAYVSDMASDMVGYPVGAGGSVQWKALTPLFARIDSGADPTTILVNDTANVLPFAAVGVAGAVKTNSLLLVDTLEYPFDVTSVLTVNAFGSIVITATSNTSGALSAFKVRLTWYRSLAGGVGIIAQDEFIVPSSPSQTVWTTAALTVRGPYVRVQIEPTSVAVGVDAWTVDVYGQSAHVPESYMTDGDGGSTVYDKYAALPPFNILNGAVATWHPGVIAGRARMSVRFVNGAAGGNFVTTIRDMTTGGALVIFRDNMFGPWTASASRQIEWTAPRSPVEIRFANNGGATEQIEVGLVYEGVV